jgi:glutathione S-transferase
MPMPTLVIANKNYSSWSLRPWLVLRHAGVRFEEKVIPLGQPDSKAEILRYSPSGRVPCLIDGENCIWDSLAICEYVAEAHQGLWPAQREVRARARAVSAEMHSGFAALRTHMPMNCRASFPGRGRTPEVEADIARIVSIWSDCLARHANDGPFLFGAFSIADAMYAPVVWRLRTYAVELPPQAQDWAQRMVSLAPMQEWLQAARAEPWSIPDYE